MASSEASHKPSVLRQKQFVVENVGVLNRETKLAILSIVMMEVGPSVVTTTGGGHDLDIDLDALADANEDVLGHVFNIVRARREALNQPARYDSADKREFRR